MSQSQVSYSHLLVLIQLSPSIPSIHFNDFIAHPFDFLSKMSPLLTSQTSEPGSQFPASGELGVVFARSAHCHPWLLIAIEVIYAILRSGLDIAHVLTSHTTLSVKVCFIVIEIGIGLLSILIVYLKFRGGK